MGAPSDWKEETTVILTCRLDTLQTDFSNGFAIVRYAEGSSFCQLELSGEVARHVPVIPELVRQPFDEGCLDLARRYRDILEVTKTYLWERELGE